MVAADHAGFLERAHPAQARRRGQPDALRQLDVGDAAFVLQLGQQPAVDLIEDGHVLRGCSLSRLPAAADPATFLCFRLPSRCFCHSARARPCNVAQGARFATRLRCC